MGGWDTDINEYRHSQIITTTDSAFSYELPPEFCANPVSDLVISEEKCRLMSYDCQIRSSGMNRLFFKFSRIDYLDYLRSGEFLDAPLPGSDNVSFRDRYADDLNLSDFASSRLTNICGVGVFIITRDNKVIVSKHSRHVKVYEGVWSYSASGTMDWKDHVHPLEEVARECFEEIGHNINFDDTFLFQFGIDTRKLYFQFSFFERSSLSSQEIIYRARMARDFHAEMERLAYLPFDLEEIVSMIQSQTWEPAAAAALITLCTKQFGFDKVEKAIDPSFVQRRFREEMIAEWDQRASRRGDLAVMSTRYPLERCAEESRKYNLAVSDFMGDDVSGKDVLEIGAGIGRLTKLLVHKAGQLTCVDLSGRMLRRNRENLGNISQNVLYLQMFGQNYRRKKKHDMAISSLVLIHNVDDESFRELVEAMSTSADTIFLFEHIDTGYQVSSQTRPRTEEELVSAFSEYGLAVAKRLTYHLFNDNVIFLKLNKPS